MKKYISKGLLVALMGVFALAGTTKTFGQVLTVTSTNPASTYDGCGVPDKITFTFTAGGILNREITSLADNKTANKTTYDAGRYWIEISAKDESNNTVAISGGNGTELFTDVNLLKNYVLATPIGGWETYFASRTKITYTFAVWGIDREQTGGSWYNPTYSYKAAQKTSATYTINKSAAPSPAAWNGANSWSVKAGTSISMKFTKTGANFGSGAGKCCVKYIVEEADKPGVEYASAIWPTGNTTSSNGGTISYSVPPGSFNVRLIFGRYGCDGVTFIPWGDELTGSFTGTGFSFSGPVRPSGAVYKDYNYLYDTVPYCRAVYSGKTLVDGQWFVDVVIKDGSGYTKPIIARDTITTVERLGNWCLPKAKWDRSKLTAPYCAVNFYLYENDGSGMVLTDSLKNFYFTMVEGGPGFAWGANKGPRPSYTPGAGAQQWEITAVNATKSSFNQYHGGNLIEITFTDYSTTPPTQTQLTSGTTINLPASYFANNGKYNIHVHFKQYFDGQIIDWPEEMDLDQTYYVMNAPTDKNFVVRKPHRSISVDTLPGRQTADVNTNYAYKYRSGWWKNIYTIFYDHPEFEVIPSGTLGEGEGKYYMVAVTAHRCAFLNNLYPDRYPQYYRIDTIKSEDQLANYSPNLDGIPVPPGGCEKMESFEDAGIGGDGWSLNSLSGTLEKDVDGPDWGTYFGMVYHGDIGGGKIDNISYVPTNRERDEYQRLVYYYKIFDGQPVANATTDKEIYLRGDAATINYQLANVHRGGFRKQNNEVYSQGHARVYTATRRPADANKALEALTWSEPDSGAVSLSVTAMNTPGEYTVYFRFDLSEWESWKGVNPEDDHFVDLTNGKFETKYYDSIKFTVLDNQLPAVTFSPTQAEANAHGAYYEPVTVTLTCPGAENIMWRYGTTGAFSVYDGPITVSATTRVEAYGAASQALKDLGVQDGPQGYVDYTVLMMNPTLEAGSNIALGGIYSGTKDADFNIQHKDLLNAGSTTQGTVNFRKIGDHAAYFSIVGPAGGSDTTVTRSTTLANLPVKVRYSYQSSSMNLEHKVGIEVTHTHATGVVLKDTMWITAMSLSCPKPTNVNVADAGIWVNFATATFEGNSANSGYDYRYGDNATTVNGDNVGTAIAGGNINNTVELNGLKAGTAYYFQVRSKCGTGDATVVTDWTSGTFTFTTKTPGLTLAHPEENEEYHGDVSVDFTVSNFNVVESVPDPLPAKYMPYGTAKVEILQGSTVIQGPDNVTDGHISYSLPNGNYTARITLSSLEPNDKTLVPDVVKTENFTVKLPKLPTPTIAVSGDLVKGTVIYDSAQLELACDTPGVTLWYKLSGDADFSEYNAEAKPWIKSTANANITVLAKATKAKRGNSETAEAEYEVRPLYKVESAAALYAYYDELSETYAPSFKDKYFQVNGSLIVTHTDSSDIYKRRIYVQDKGGKASEGKRSLAIRIYSGHKNIHPKDYNRKDEITGIIGQMVKNEGFLRFMPIDEPIAVKSSGNDIYVDTLTLAEIKNNKVMYHGDLACIQYVYFNNTTDVEKATFKYDQFYTMTGPFGQTLRFRTDFAKADYLGWDRPASTEKYFITGILTQAEDNEDPNVDYRARITPRDQYDIVKAPYLDIATANTNLGVLYARTAKVDAALTYGNHSGTPTVELVKNTRGFELGTITMADGTGTFIVTYNFQSTPGMDTAWVVARYRDLTDTLKVWAESKSCPKPTGVSASGVGQQTATIQFNGTYVRFEIETATVDNEWGETQSTTDHEIQLTDLSYSTTYYYQVKGVCADFGDGTVVKSDTAHGSFTTGAQGAKSITLKAGYPDTKITTDVVSVDFTVSNFSLTGDPGDGGAYGQVKIIFYDYTGETRGDEIASKVTTEKYDTYLPSGRYLVEAHLVDMDGNDFDPIAFNSRAFTVDLPDVDKPVIAAVAPFISPKANEYYDSVTLQITCEETGATLTYSYDGENYDGYTEALKIKDAGLTTVYAKAAKDHKDDGCDTLGVKIITDPAVLSFSNGTNRNIYSYTTTTLSWKSDFSHSYDINVKYLREDMAMEVRPQKDCAPAIRIVRPVLPKDEDENYTTSSTVNIYAADPLVGVGTYHDTVVISTQGRELGRILVNLTVQAFTVPKVNIAPANNTEHQRSVEVSMTLPATAHPAEEYEIHYTLDGSVPTRETAGSGNEKCFVYTAPFTLANTLLPSKDTTVKALAFHMVESNADTTKESNLTTATYRLYNPVEILHAHDEVLDATITINDHFTRTIKHAAKYLTDEVSIRVGARKSDEAVAVKVTPDRITGLTGLEDSINFTVNEVAGIMPGEYQDTILITSAGKVLCKKVVNLKVTSFMVPKVKIEPVADRYESEVEVSIDFDMDNSIRTNPAADETYRNTNYYINYTIDGVTSPTRDNVSDNKTFRYEGPFTLTTDKAQENITVKAVVYDRTRKDTTNNDVMTTVTYTLYNNPVILSGEEVVTRTVCVDSPAGAIPDKVLAYTAKYLAEGLAISVVKRESDAATAISVTPGSIAPDATSFDMTLVKNDVPVGEYQDTILMKAGGKVIYKTVVNLSVEWPPLPDMHPRLFAGDNVDLGYIYEGTKDAEFKVRYRDVWDSRADNKGTVTYTLFGDDKDYFELVQPSASERYPFELGETKDVDVTVRYTFQSEHIGEHKVGLALSHTSINTEVGTIVDTMYISAESRLCPVPDVVKIDTLVTFAVITMNGTDATKFTMRYAEEAELLLSNTSPESYRKHTNTGTFILDSLKAGTTYYYQVKSYCTENTVSSGFETKHFTTLMPKIDLKQPGDGQVYDRDITVEFEALNMNLGEVPAAPEATYMPYGTAKVELLKGEDVLWNSGDITTGKATHLLESGDYTARVTLHTVTPGPKVEGEAPLVPDVVVTHPVKVNLRDVSKPKFTPATGTVHYDSLQLTLACDTPGATIYYSLNKTDWKTYNDAEKPWIKTPANQNALVKVYAKAAKTGYDESKVDSATYEIRPLLKLKSAAELYNYYDVAGARENFVPAFEDRYFRLDGSLIVTHTDSSAPTMRRIYVQDKGGDVEKGRRSLVIRALSTRPNLSVKKFNRGDEIAGIIGQIVNNDSLLRFVPVDDAIGVKSTGNDIFVDTVSLAEIKANKVKYHGDLACVTYVSFDYTNDENKVKFKYDEYYTMTCRHGENMRLRTDFKHADYLGMDRPSPDKQYFITGILTQTIDKTDNSSRARITPRDKKDIVEAPFVDITTPNTSLGTFYTGSATLDAKVKYGNHEGNPTLDLVKNTRGGFVLGTLKADSTFTVTYTYNGEPGKDTAWIVAKYRDLTDTLRVWAESKLCDTPTNVSVPSTGGHTATIEFSGTYLRFEIDTTTVENSWHDGKTISVTGVNELDLTDMPFSTTYYYRIRGVCANSVDNTVTVNSKYVSGSFTTADQSAMTIALAAGKPAANNDGPVQIAYTVDNMGLGADAEVEEGGKKGLVRLYIFKNDNDVLGDTVIRIFTTKLQVDTFLPTGRYMASVRLVDLDSVAYEGNESQLMSRRAFNVKLPDVAKPVITIVGSPVSPKPGEYYDSVSWQITCTDNTAALAYKYNKALFEDYTGEQKIKPAPGGKYDTTVYTRSSKYHMDNNYDTMGITVITLPVVLHQLDGENEYYYTANTLNWNKDYPFLSYGIKVDYLRENMKMEVRPSGENAAFRLRRSELQKETTGYYTERSIQLYADTTEDGNMKVGVGTYHDTIVISTQGIELDRILVHTTVSAFEIPAVIITPADGSEHQHSVKVAMKLPEVKHPASEYEIHYTLDGSMPTRELVAGKCFKYEDTITLTNEDLATLDTTVKALAFHMVEANADITREENVAVATYTLKNPAEIIAAHDDSHDFTLTILENLNQELKHTAKFITGEVTIRIYKRASDEKVAVTATPATFAAGSTEVNFTLNKVANLKPGSYQDTIQIWHGGKVLCQKVVNLKVTSFNIPKVIITPKGGNYEDFVTVTMALPEGKHTGAVYEIRYTTDGSTPTDSSKLYTGPFKLIQENPGIGNFTVNALGFDKTKMDTTQYKDSLATMSYAVTYQAYPSVAINPRPAPQIEEGYPVNITVEVKGATLPVNGSGSARLSLEIFEDGLSRYYDNNMEANSSTYAQFTKNSLENSSLEDLLVGHTYTFVFILHKTNGEIWRDRDFNPIADTCTIEIVEEGTVLKDYDIEWVKAPDTVDIYPGFDSLLFIYRFKDNTGSGLPPTLAVTSALYNEEGYAIFTNIEVNDDVDYDEENGVYVLNEDYFDYATDYWLAQRIVPGNYSLKLTLYDVGSAESGSVNDWREVSRSTRKFTVVKSVFPALAITPEPEATYEEGAEFDITVRILRGYLKAQGTHEADASIRLTVYEGETALYSGFAADSTYNTAVMNSLALEEDGFEGFKKDHTYTIVFTACHLDGSLWKDYYGEEITDSCTITIVEPKEKESYAFEWLNAPAIINIFNENYEQFLFTFRLTSLTGADLPDNLKVKVDLRYDETVDNVSGWLLENADIEADASGVYTINQEYMMNQQAVLPEVGDYILALNLFRAESTELLGETTHKFRIYNTDDVPDPVKLPSVKFEPDGGNFEDSVWVVLSCDSVAAEIYYRLSDDAPFVLYKGTFKLTDTFTVEAFAHMDDVLRINSDTLGREFNVADTWVEPAPEPVKLPSVKFEPNGGTHYDSVWVKLSHDSAAAEIYYRLSSDDEFALYTDSVKLTELTTTVEAFAHMDGELLVNSDTAKVMFVVLKSGEENPVIKLPSVEFKPAAGEFNDSVWVTLGCGNTDAAIYYRLASDDEFGLYTVSFKLTDTTTVEAFAHIDGDLFENSDTVSALYNVADTWVEPPVPEPVKLSSVVFAPDGGNFNDSVWVALSHEDAAAKIYYRFYENKATAGAFALYTGKFKLTDTMTVEAFAHRDGEGFINSDTVSTLFNVADTYVEPAPEPVKLPLVKVEPAGGDFNDSVWVSLSHDSADAKIYYRIYEDIAEAGAFTLYTEAFKLTDTAYVEAYAYMDGAGFVNSDMVEVLFNVAATWVEPEPGPTPEPEPEETITPENVKLYPNPTQGEFNVLVPDGADVQVFGLNGDVLYLENNVSGVRTYKARTAGLYYVRVTVGKEKVIKKVIVR